MYAIMYERERGGDGVLQRREEEDREYGVWRSGVEKEEEEGEFRAIDGGGGRRGASMGA